MQIQRYLLFLSTMNALFLYSEEASFSLHMKMKKEVSISIEPVVSDITIYRDKGDFVLSHFLSVFLSYNGFSSIKVCLISETGDANFCFSNPSQRIPCTLFNTGSSHPLSFDGGLFTYEGNSQTPLVRQEFAVGVKIDERELSKASAGSYECMVHAIIYQEG